jgi:hypothetical protein
VQAVLRAVAQRVTSLCSEEGGADAFDAFSLSSAFNGMRLMSDEQPAVRELLTGKLGTT